jgi:hypothetical protein
MAVLTGARGALKYRGAKIGKVRDWNLTVSRDALEDTCLGVNDRTYVKGLRGAAGSATVLYDPDDTAAGLLLNSIFEDANNDDTCEFIFNEPDGGAFKCSAFVTSMNPAVTVGDIQAVSLSFQVTGPIEGRY